MANQGRNFSLFASSMSISWTPPKTLVIILPVMKLIKDGEVKHLSNTAGLS